MQKKAVHYFIISTFVTLYLLVSVISTIHVVEFFSLSNPNWLAISLAVAFEVGAAASLASLITLEKMNKGMVWGLFIILTLMQAMGNTYYAYTHLHDFQGWIELFGLTEEDLIYQKRILSLVSGAILPVVALGFVKSLVDYIKPEPAVTVNDQITDSVTQVNNQITDEVTQAPVKIEEPMTEPTEIVEPQEVTVEVVPSPEKVDEPVVETTTEPKVDNIKPESSQSIDVDSQLARGRVVFNSKP